MEAVGASDTEALTAERDLVVSISDTEMTASGR